MTPWSIRASGKTVEDVMKIVEQQIEDQYYPKALPMKLADMTRDQLHEELSKPVGHGTEPAKHPKDDPYAPEVKAITELIRAKLSQVTLTKGANQSLDVYIPYGGIQIEVLVRTEKDGTDHKQWSGDGKTYIVDGRTFNADGTPVDGRRTPDGKTIGEVRVSETKAVDAHRPPVHI